MGRRPPPGLSARRAVRLVAALAATLTLLAGCTAPASDRPTGPATTAAPGAPSGSVADASSVQGTLDALAAAARDGDRAGWDALVQPADAASADRLDVLAANLATLPLDRLTLRPLGSPTPTPTASSPTGGRLQQVDVRWRLAGEAAEAQHTVEVVLVPGPDGRPRLAGLGDGVGELPAEPLWWREPVGVVQRDGVVVLAGPGQEAAAWAGRVGVAVQRLHAEVSAAGAADWRGPAVVEVPGSAADLESVLGAEPGSYTQVAAVALAEAPTADGAVRVLVNPEAAARLTDDGVALVLLHELVHVATHSVDSPAPTWMVEGFADTVALRAYPAAGPGAAAALLARVRAQGPPDRLPDDGAFLAGADDLAVSYAEAWLACRYVAEHWSYPDLQRLYTALDDATPPEQAVPDLLGVSLDGLVAGWQADLRRRAGG